MTHRRPSPRPHHSRVSRRGPLQTLPRPPVVPHHSRGIRVSTLRGAFLLRPGPWRRAPAVPSASSLTTMRRRRRWMRSGSGVGAARRRLLVAVPVPVEVPVEVPAEAGSPVPRARPRPVRPPFRKLSYSATLLKQGALG